MHCENPLEIFPYGALPLPTGKSDPFRGGGMDIFWNHTIQNGASSAQWQ